MTIMTAVALGALRKRRLRSAHVDTSDHRRVGNVGRLDVRNVSLGLLHGIRMWRLTARKGSALVYLPIAQGALGFARDALLLEAAFHHRIPVVIHLHGAAFGRFYGTSNPITQFLIRRCMGRVRSAIVLSESLRGVFGDLISPERVFVVRNGIPAPLAVAKAEGESPGVHILYLSNLTPAKGYRDVIEAAAEVLSGHPEARFTIAGEWPRIREQRDAEKLVRQLGLDGRLRFIPTVSGLRKGQLYAAADIFVFPPRQLEGQPVVILEAMSHGLPVISTPQGGISDTVADGQTGLLVTPGDTKALSAAISKLIRDRELRERMGEAGRRRYLSLFTEETYGKNLTSVLLDSLDPPGALALTGS